VGGLALGALAAGAANGGYGYGYGAPVYAAPPVYAEPACWYERQQVWNGYAWVLGRVRVCQ
ncbi:MAG: uncharacterized protein JWN93_871, partial [Hyphomicrobiales bacterium]|nr:uncharacterized protein [Hyphomicrobiales bacterium]